MFGLQKKSEEIYFIKVYTLPVFLAIIMLITLGIQVYELKVVRASLNQTLANLIIQKEQINEIYQAFGYGGFIHDFKNYILRGDEKYFTSLSKNRDKVLQQLNLFSRQAKSNRMKLQVKLITKAVNSYYDKAKDVQSLIESNKSVKEIDSLVKIDDTEYLKAFDRIQLDLKMKEQETMQSIDYLFNEMMVVYIVSIFASSVLVFTVTLLSNKKMAAARQKSENLAKTKSDFLASMSHEIRTPMNGVLGMTQILEETSLDVEQKKMVGTIKSSGKLLLSIINDILDLSKIESGHLNLECVDFNLKKSVEEVFDLLKLNADRSFAVTI